MNPAHTNITLKLPLKLALVLAASGLCAAAANATPLIVDISGLQNAKGEVRCGLFSGEAGWRNEEQATRTVSASIQGTSARCDFGDVPPGQYAVALFHAQDGETKVSYGFLGKPKQGVGFSNNPSITFGPPDFAKARFELGATPLTLAVEMKY